MNRADFSMALGQADQLGNTLLQNRVMKQQATEREADRGLRNAEIGLRRDDNSRQLNKQKLDEENAYFTGAYKTVMENPNITDEEIARHNKKLENFQYLGGLRVARPIPKNTNQTLAPALDSDGKEIGLVAPNGTFHRKTPNKFSDADKFVLDDLKDQLKSARERLSKANDAAPTDATGKPDEVAEKSSDIAKRNKLKLNVDALQKKIDDIINPGGAAATSPTTPQPAPAAAQGKPLDAAMAKQLLQEAGGDKQKARELATQRGFSF